jgi:hypothetical protein
LIMHEIGVSEFNADSLRKTSKLYHIPKASEDLF